MNCRLSVVDFRKLWDLGFVIWDLFGIWDLQSHSLQAPLMLGKKKARHFMPGLDSL